MTEQLQQVTKDFQKAIESYSSQYESRAKEIKKLDQKLTKQIEDEIK